MKKYRFWVILYGFAITFTLFLLFLDSALPDGNLHVSFLNIGQGDSTLITTPKGKHILIDGGPFNNIEQVLPQKLGFFHSRIDLMILSHAHDDHLMGLLNTLQKYDVRTVLISAVQTSSDSYKAFLEMIDGHDVRIASVEDDLMVEPGIYVDILAADSKAVFVPEDQLNDHSLVVRLSYGDTSLLLTGDMTTEEENSTLLAGSRVKSTILKVAHHGSKYSSGEQFIQAISPQTAVISVGEGNRFKHPSPSVLSMLNKQDIQVYRTDKNGNVDMSCDTHQHCSVITEGQPMVFVNARDVLSN